MLDAYNIGVEEEYQLVDPETGGLRNRASEVLSTDWADALQGELHETTVEIGTSICRGLEEVEAELRRRRFQAATTAAAEGVEIAAAGLHPFSSWESHLIRPLQRYEGIERHHERVAREATMFGMHVHVSVPSEIDRTRLMAQVRSFIPHLLALSASSPYLDAGDTGFASYRSILWRQFPYTGIPPRFDSEEEYERFIGLLLRSQAVRDRGNLYWSLRPHPSYPTLEFRAMDVCPSLEDAATIAAFIRLLVASVAERRFHPSSGGDLAADLWRSVLVENEWHVARYGLEAFLTDPEAENGRTPVRAAIRRLLEVVAGTAAELGETVVLERVERLLEKGTAAERMRRVYAEHHSFEEVVAWIVRETRLGTGFDRRRAQRTGSG
jgi:glutamate---cysteine ligase / carboxylate-amine ligase